MDDKRAQELMDKVVTPRFAREGEVVVPLTEDLVEFMKAEGNTDSEPAFGKVVILPRWLHSRYLRHKNQSVAREVKMRRILQRRRH